MPAKAVYLLECLPTGILRFFLGFPAIAKNGSRQIQTPPVMALKEFSKRVLIAITGCFNELWIAEYIGRFAQGATSLGFSYRSNLGWSRRQFVGQPAADRNLLIFLLIPQMHSQLTRFKLPLQGQLHLPNGPKWHKSRSYRESKDILGKMRCGLHAGIKYAGIKFSRAPKK